MDLGRRLHWYTFEKTSKQEKRSGISEENSIESSGSKTS
jgi:hypothetical protein